MQFIAALHKFGGAYCLRRLLDTIQQQLGPISLSNELVGLYITQYIEPCKYAPFIYAENVENRTDHIVENFLIENFINHIDLKNFRGMQKSIYVASKICMRIFNFQINLSLNVYFCKKFDENHNAS